MSTFKMVNGVRVYKTVVDVLKEKVEHEYATYELNLQAGRYTATEQLKAKAKIECLFEALSDIHFHLIRVESDKRFFDEFDARTQPRDSHVEPLRQFDAFQRGGVSV